jgi:hypothetical protein
MPFTLGELPEVVETDASFKTPGLNSLSYELYKATFGQVLPGGLDAILGHGLLSLPALRLLTKVPGAYMDPQFKPTTLLYTVYTF